MTREWTLRGTWAIIGSPESHAESQAMKDYADVILCPEATELSKVRPTWSPPPKMPLVNQPVPALKALPAFYSRQSSAILLSTWKQGLLALRQRYRKMSAATSKLPGMVTIRGLLGHERELRNYGGVRDAPHGSLSGVHCVPPCSPASPGTTTRLPLLLVLYFAAHWPAVPAAGATGGCHPSS